MFYITAKELLEDTIHAITFGDDLNKEPKDIVKIISKWGLNNNLGMGLDCTTFNIECSFSWDNYSREYFIKEYAILLMEECFCQIQTINRILKEHSAIYDDFTEELSNRQDNINGLYEALFDFVYFQYA